MLLTSTRESEGTSMDLLCADESAATSMIDSSEEPGDWPDEAALLAALRRGDEAHRSSAAECAQRAKRAAHGGELATPAHRSSEQRTGAKLK